MALTKSPKECLVCLNSVETTLVPTEESQKIFNICCWFVKDAINIEFLINNIVGNNCCLSFCKNCLDSSKNLSQLVEQLSKLKKQINNFTNQFSETIAKRRIQATANAFKKQFISENTFFHATNNGRVNLDSSSVPILHEISSDSDSRNSFMPLESSNELIAEQVANDGIRSEIVKNENDVIFLDCEDKSDNLACYKEQENDTNYMAKGNENEINPLGGIDLQSPSGIVNSFNNVNEWNPPRETFKSHSGFISSVAMPNIVAKQIQKDDPWKRSGALQSIKTSRQTNPRANLKKNISGAGDSNCNSMTETNKLKFKKSKPNVKKSEYKHICSICSKTFFTLRDLQRHHLTHTGEKPFKCAICEKAYRQAQDLRIHERLHTGEKPYKCSWCESRFVRIHTLKYHEKIHKIH